jgi:hypothetical protein
MGDRHLQLTPFRPRPSWDSRPCSGPSLLAPAPARAHPCSRPHPGPTRRRRDRCIETAVITAQTPHRSLRRHSKHRTQLRAHTESLPDARPSRPTPTAQRSMYRDGCNHSPNPTSITSPSQQAPHAAQSPHRISPRRATVQAHPDGAEIDVPKLLQSQPETHTDHCAVKPHAKPTPAPTGPPPTPTPGPHPAPQAHPHADHSPTPGPRSPDGAEIDVPRRPQSQPETHTDHCAVRPHAKPTPAPTGPPQPSPQAHTHSDAAEIDVPKLLQSQP